MRVIAIDPGLTRCGLAVIDCVTSGQPEMVAVGVVRTTANRATGDRLAYVQDELDKWLDRFLPEVFAVERPYAADHVPSIMNTAAVAGLAHLAAARRGLPVHQYTPTEVKAAVTGSGAADKRQVTMMVTRILRLESPPRPADAADALALALCHAWRGGATERLALAAASERARLAARSAPGLDQRSLTR